MKYIRTKCGIYEVIEECFKPMENNMVFIPGEGLTKILNQADTIEKLCDEFVEYNRERNQGFYIREYELKECRNVVRKQPSILEHSDIFGAIWTDKGLIYVAKMNEKGELELL